MSAAKTSTTQILRDLMEEDPAFAGNERRLAWAADRWLHGLAYLGRRIGGSRRTVYWLRGPMVFGALLVPILATGAANSPSGAFWRWSTVGVSVVVALCATIDQGVRPATRWRLVRETRGDLEAEGWALLERSGKYATADDDERFHLFFKAVERMWIQYERVYLTQITHTQSTREPDGVKGASP